MSEPSTVNDALIGDIRQLIDVARRRASSAVNAELTLLYWQVARGIGQEVLEGERAEYGKQVLSSLSRQLTAEYGKGWSEQQLRHCLRLADTFPDEQILSALRRELSWTHFKTLGSFRTEYKGQMELYLRWLSRYEQEAGEASPLGIVLCAGKKQEQIELLELDKSGIHVAEYLTVLPPRETLEAKLHQSIETARKRLENKEASE